MGKATYSIVPYHGMRRRDQPSLTLAELSEVTGIERSQLRRFARFAVIESHGDCEGALRFPISELPRLARGVRLRRHLGVGVSSLGLVLDLLERVDALEREVDRLRRETVRKRETS